MRAETLSPVMFTKASAKSLNKVEGEADRINFASCGVTETTKIQGCLRNNGSMERIRKMDGKFVK